MSYPQRVAAAASRQGRQDRLDLGATLQRAVTLHQSGQLAEAEELYRQVLDVAPNQVDALHLLGVIARQNGQPERALELIRRALTLAPDTPEMHVNLANALADLSRFAEAEASCQRALTLRPAYAGAHLVLGKLLTAQRQPAEAIERYRQAVDLDPTQVEAWFALGQALQAVGRLEAAVAAFQRTVELRPDHVEAHNDLGNALHTLGWLDAAASALERALALRPDYAEAHNNLGNVRLTQGQHQAALDSYRQALALRPDYLQAGDNLLFGLLYAPDVEPAELLAEHRRAGARYHTPTAQPRRHTNSADPERRLRVGYVSPDFRYHAVAFAILPLLANHDRARFGITLYSNVARPDALTDLIRGLADRWRDVCGVDDQALADQIEQDQVDLLVDLACHTAGNRLGAFAYKPAPVQITHSVLTSGLPAMDYLLSDHTLAPDLPEQAIVEQLIRLPRCYTSYAPAADAPAVAPLPALTSGQVTFGSFNNLAKITPAVAALWTAVLQAVPGSRLLLKSSQPVDQATCQRFRARFEQAGLAGERVLFAERTAGLVEHLALYGQVDVGLDPFPFNGFTTTCEALWMGVPVVTLAGRLFADRGGASILRGAGLPELVAANESDYVAIAVDLVADRVRLSALRAGLRQHLAQSELCDGGGYARAVEAAYRACWRRWCAA